MSRSFILLLVLQLKVNYGLSIFRRNLARDKKAALKSLGIFALATISVGSVALVYTAIMSLLFDSLVKVEMEQIVLLYGTFATQLIGLVISLPYLFGTIFFAKDTTFLASLPVKPGAIFAAKMSIVLIGEYLVTLPMAAIPYIIFGVRTGQGVAYYLIALAVALIIPFIPTAATSILALVFMRAVTAIKRANTLISLSGMLLAMGLVAGNIALMRVMSTGTMDSFVKNAVVNQTDLVSAMSRAFPPLRWVVVSLAELNLGSFALFALVSAISAVIAILIASGLYQRTSMALLESARSGNRIRTRANNIYRSSPTTLALFVREWKMLLRTPAFALNSLIFIVLGPLMFNKAVSGSILAQDPDTKPIFDLMLSDAHSELKILAVAGLLAFTGLINPAAATVISREGSGFWLFRVVPISPWHQVRAKLLAVFSVSFTAITTTGLTLALSYRLGSAYFILGYTLAVLAALPVTSLSVLIDLKNPKLDWVNPNQVMKQNVNVLLAMAVSAVVIGLPGWGAYHLAKTGWSMVQVFAAFASVLVLLGFALVAGLKKTAGPSYLRM